MSDWTKYADRQPQFPGVYEWRIPSASVPGAIITFRGHVGLRIAGFQEVLAPKFAHWDGWQLVVPENTEWRPSASSAPLDLYCFDDLSIGGVENVACPFCGKVPRWAAIERSPDGGVMVGGMPHLYNSWWLECCQWGSTPHLSDPRELSAFRNRALAKGEE